MASSEKAAFRRERMRAVMEHLGWSQAEWCDRASLKNASALGNFLADNEKSPKSLNLDTLEPLAKAAGLVVSQLTGEMPFSWEDGSEPSGDGNHPKQSMKIVVEGEDFHFSRTVSADEHRIRRMLEIIMS